MQSEETLKDIAIRLVYEHNEEFEYSLVYEDDEVIDLELSDKEMEKVLGYMHDADITVIL